MDRSSRPRRDRQGQCTGPPSDAQIAYFVARFFKNVRSLSTDPVVVRANWTDALGYVTDCGTRMLGAYAADARPYLKVGLQSVTVEIIFLVRGILSPVDLKGVG